MRPLYAVLEVGLLSEPDDQAVTLFADLADACSHALDLRVECRDDGRRETYRVFELVEVQW